MELQKKKLISLEVIGGDFSDQICRANSCQLKIEQ